MNTIIIQPADSTPPLKNREGFSAASQLSYSPAFHLIGLNSHININSRHKCLFVDTRTLAHPVHTLLDEIKATPTPRLAVVNAETHSLDQTLFIVRIIKDSFPDLHIGLCGQHATEFPAEALDNEHIDFVLSGDPEPILKQYLDYIDLPQRLAKSEGLQLPGNELHAPAYISPNLSEVAAMPSWPTNFWANYRVEGPHPVCEADFRVTRGNSGLPPDRAFPQAGEPLRRYDFQMLSMLMERCSAVSVNHVNFSDPPGVWSAEFLLGFCNSLADYHVRQQWGFQMLPSALSHKEHAAMYESWCKRVDFLFPSCDPEILERYGIPLDLPALKGTIATLKRHRITPTIRYWLGGPEATKNEADQVIHTIRALGYCDFMLQPFPLHFSSAMYQEYAASMPGTPTPEDFVAWSKNPDQVEKPVPLWGGAAQAQTIERTVGKILRTINRSPGRMVKKFKEQLAHTPWIEKLESKGASIDVIGPPTRDL